MLGADCDCDYDYAGFAEKLPLLAMTSSIRTSRIPFGSGERLFGPRFA
mgnify:CR=1 FL=1